MRNRLKTLEAHGYAVADAEVSFVLAWRPREEDKEIAVCLANLVVDNSPTTSSFASDALAELYGGDAEVLPDILAEKRGVGKA